MTDTAPRGHDRTSDPSRIVVGVSGATGIVYAIRLLQLLREFGIETHLVVTRPGEITLAYETDMSTRDLRALAAVNYAVNDVGAAISSGSFSTMGMIVAPCSMRSLGAIAAGTGDTLLARAADVVLKERRRLVLLTRETPLHAGHLRNMLRVTEMGGIIFPPVPAFYTKPDSLGDMIDHSCARVLDLFGLDAGVGGRWTGKPVAASPTARNGKDPT